MKKLLVVVVVVVAVAAVVLNLQRTSQRAEDALIKTLCSGEIDGDLERYVLNGDRPRMTGTIADGANAQLMWNSVRRSSLGHHVPALQRLAESNDVEKGRALGDRLTAACPDRFPHAGRAGMRLVMVLKLAIPQD